MKKVLASICLLAFLGCEQDNSGDSSYTFSEDSSVGSISEPDKGGSGELAKIVTSDGNYVVVITTGCNLQRVKAGGDGYVNIPVEQYTIITPGDSIQFAWTKNDIDYAPRPPVVRPSTVVIQK